MVQQRTYINQMALAVFAGLLGLGFVVYLLGNQYLKLKAFDDCAKASTYTFVNTEGAEEVSKTTTVSEPKHDFYIACIKDKGYETSIQK